MEKYFDKYRGLLEEQEFEPQTTESQFLSRLHEREGGVKAFAESSKVLKPSKKSRRTKTLTYTIMGVAAAVVLALVLPWGEEERLDPAVIYVTNYLDGVQPILAEVNAMESSSEVCREMGFRQSFRTCLGLRRASRKVLKDWMMRRSWQSRRSIAGGSWIVSGIFTGSAARPMLRLLCEDKLFKIILL